ncbi:MAG: UDP-glucose 4-epimerase GalE [Chloroflexota bacterium]|nr:UDP-glucose 4-epimerase GalE [Chloroflexota bacterium]
MKVLVTGGAGYIGSHTVRELVERGNEVVILDSLELGYRQALEALGVSDKLVVGDTSDGALLDRIFQEHKPDAVIHFAAYKNAGESMENPSKYFSNNFSATISLLDAMVRNQVKYIVFSSSCAIFGNVQQLPVNEENNLPNPESPYGESKLLVEKALKWYDVAYSLKSVSLRYFNVAGSALDTKIGEDWSVSLNLIPVTLKAALGVTEAIKVFGTDYPTRDGTCIRDYIHVVDLAIAHLYALDYLLKTSQSTAYNLGTGDGSTVKEVIDAAKSISGVDFKVIEVPRRPGDPAAIWADSSKAERELGWKAQYNLDDMVRSAYNWHKSHLQGWKS